MKPRHEFKHYINKNDYMIIKSRISKIMKIDRNAGENGEYKIRSLYFDNYNNKALQEKLIGISKREKFRIRFYNNDLNFIKLEKKSKERGLCTKQSCKLSVDDCNLIISGNIQELEVSERPLLRELVLKMRNELLRPKTVVDYIREAYIFSTGNVRITFDKSIRTGINNIDILSDNLPTIASINKDLIILEVKYDNFLPEIICDIIQTGQRSKTAISKYALCRIYG
ncbi:polyphosphate polymerase domain-containing protein [Anaerovorax odorimutans]|uniref:polyphosphate polymerase domain-containing protein n=1 Tax=Anaerovorax odorimutans TaxID=109327 RepID=UPI0003F9F305|nr:polyphosphate polymerase domain-containing protein [Anaerovorax odorimutans]